MMIEEENAVHDVELSEEFTERTKDTKPSEVVINTVEQSVKSLIQKHNNIYKSNVDLNTPKEFNRRNEDIRRV